MIGKTVYCNRCQPRPHERGWPRARRGIVTAQDGDSITVLFADGSTVTESAGFWYALF